MKQNYLTLVVGILLAAIFALLLFTFQVHQTEVAMVTTFGKPTRDLHEPGLYAKWPWPIQRVQKFDNRIQTFEDKFEETMTKDGRNILITTYLGWSIEDPVIFRERFAGSAARAQGVLEGLTRSAKLAVVGRHPFSHFISTNEDELKFNEIENQMLATIRPLASSYGMDVKFLGIRKLGLPESVTEHVFNRMREERQVQVETLRTAGEREAIRIRSEADRARAEIIAEAEARATRIRGEADAEAAKYYAILEQNPELAVLLLKLNALELALKKDATLILDRNTPPFDVLNPARQQMLAPAQQPTTQSAKTP